MDAEETYQHNLVNLLLGQISILEHLNIQDLRIGPTLRYLQTNNA